MTSENCQGRDAGYSRTTLEDETLSGAMAAFEPRTYTLEKPGLPSSRGFERKVDLEPVYIAIDGLDNLHECLNQQNLE